MLIVFGGLPGTGKTTLAKALATKYAAVYLGIDTIEQAIRSSGVLRDDIESDGYITAYWLAEENLYMGRSVVADSVNPLQITRNSWAHVAQEDAFALGRGGSNLFRFSGASETTGRSATGYRRLAFSHLDRRGRKNVRNLVCTAPCLGYCSQVDQRGRGRIDSACSGRCSLFGVTLFSER